MKMMSRDPEGVPEIPLTACPECKGGFMAIKTVKPRLLRSGIEVEFTCPRCETVVVSSVNPAQVRRTADAGAIESERQSAE